MAIEVYCVGGCVRDVLLGREPKDIDYVWTGASPQHLIDMGMTQVGVDFPVFLDANGDEHALARTERKTGVGYKGFECTFDSTVTLEQDLYRRDLTCNALAVKKSNWEKFCNLPDPLLVIDLFGGIEDINAGVLRHISNHFREDPVRILRTARFAARYRFNIAPETLDLMELIVPELDAVVPERIWAEIEKGLMENYPQIMFGTLFLIKAFEAQHLAPYKGADVLVGISSQFPFHKFPSSLGLIPRFLLISSLFADDDFEKCRIPSDCANTAKVFSAQINRLNSYPRLPAAERLKVLYGFRAFNKEHLSTLINCLYAAEVINPIGDKLVRQRAIENDLHKISLSVDATKIAAACVNKKDVKDAIYNARLRCLELQ